MEYIKEKILFPEDKWNELDESIQYDLFSLISGISDTTVDLNDMDYDIVSPLPFELNFGGRYDIVRNKVQPVQKVFNNHRHVDSFYPPCYFQLRKQKLMNYRFTPEDYIKLVNVIKDCLTNSTMVYFNVFEDNCMLKKTIEKIK